MWTPLPEITETEYQHISRLWNDLDSSKLAETVHLVSRKKYADQLVAVIQMGCLRLTTALTFDSYHHIWHHPGIPLRLTEEKAISIVYNPGGSSRHYRYRNAPYALRHPGGRTTHFRFKRTRDKA